MTLTDQEQKGWWIKTTLIDLYIYIYIPYKKVIEMMPFFIIMIAFAD